MSFLKSYWAFELFLLWPFLVQITQLTITAPKAEKTHEKGSAEMKILPSCHSAACCLPSIHCASVWSLTPTLLCLIHIGDWPGDRKTSPQHVENKENFVDREDTERKPLLHRSVWF